MDFSSWGKMNYLVFDIETVPDIEGLRTLYELSPDMDEEDVADFAFAQQKDKTGSDFLPHYLHKVVCLSSVVRTEKQLTVFSLFSPKESEKEIITRFFKGVERHNPQLVSWNGGGFDLPVLHYRAMKHSVSAPHYWDLGERNNDFKWNNYLHRYHLRHLDLMDVLACYNGKAFAPLDKLSKLLGFPGKLGVDGADVWHYWQKGKADEIRQYCETDVLNTYLLFLRFRQMRGELTEAMEKEEWRRVEEFLTQKTEDEKENNDHWLEFLDSWQAWEAFKEANGG